MCVQVLPRLWLGGAVAADSRHILRHLGITHIVNATHELPPPGPGEGFGVLRVPLSDVEGQDCSASFAQVGGGLARLEPVTWMGGR